MQVRLISNDHGEKPGFVISAEDVAEGEILRMFVRPHPTESMFRIHSFGRTSGRPETFSFYFGFSEPYVAPLPEPNIYELAGIDCP